jgi:putative DNA-invertase from lambdoid prophage Rac
VGFVSLGESFNVTPGTGQALAGVLAVLAEFERERIKDGIVQAEKRARRSSN